MADKDEPSGSTSSGSSPSKAAAPTRRNLTPLRRPRTAPSSKLSKPFKSPLNRGKHPPTPPSSLSSTRSASSSKHGPPTPSRYRQRSERQQLEDRLHVLRQADKIVRDGSLDELPKLIEKWRQAGQAAAQDLWKATGASDRGPEGQSFSGDVSYSQQDESADRGQKRWRSPSPFSSRLEPLMRRSGSYGTMEQAEALQQDESGQIGKDDDWLPPELDFGPKKKRLKSYGETSRVCLSSEEEDDEERNGEEKEAEKKSIEQKWNIGKMLDLIGVDKKSLRWNAEEEDFDE